MAVFWLDRVGRLRALAAPPSRKARRGLPVTPPMRIVHWLSYFPPDVGGLETLVSRLIVEQVRAGHQVTAITSVGAAEAPPFEEFFGAAIYRLPLVQSLHSRDLVGVARLRNQIGRLVADARPDVHHVHQIGPIGFYADGVVARRQAACVVTMHSPLYPELLKSGTFFERLLHVADCVTCVSEPTFADLVGAYPFLQGAGRVIKNGLPSDRPAFAPVADGTPSHFVALGRLVPEKGFDVFLAALAILHDEGLAFHGDHRRRRSESGVR